MKTSELEAIIRGVTPAIKGYIDKELARMQGRLDEFKAPESGPPGEPGPPGEKGEPGESVDMDAVHKQVQDFLESLPTPKDGKDAEPVDMEAVQEQVRQHLESIPKPEDGKDGKDAEPVDMDAVHDQVKEYLESIPEPKDGRDGIDGKDGKDGRDGKSVTVEDVKPMLDTALARWALDFERLANEKLERAILNMPKPKDGLDGMGFDDLEFEYDGERTITFRLVKGERVKEHKITIPAVIDQGVFSKDKDYTKGDATTYGGCLWIAQTDNPEGVPGKTKDWRLSVKKGRDGKDGRDGIDKTAPVKGKKDE